MAMMQEPEDSEPVDRLYVRLAAALRQSRPNPFGTPVTVAEIYQELVPYRLVRTDAGFGMNADYEHALLRLLAGEGDCVRLEPSAARDAIRRELRSNNPNVGMYREYAGCDVWVTEPAFTPAAGSIFALADEDADTAAGAAGGTDAGRAAGADERSGWNERSPERASPDRPFTAPGTASGTVDRPADSGDGWLDDDESGTSAGAGSAAERTAGAAGAAGAHGEAGSDDASDPAYGEADADSDSDDAGNCGFCDSPLPKHRAVRFCPWCGADQTMQPCAACGEPLEEGWLFCVACGAQPGA